MVYLKLIVLASIGLGFIVLCIGSAHESQEQSRKYHNMNYARDGKIFRRR